MSGYGKIYISLLRRLRICRSWCSACVPRGQLFTNAVNVVSCVVAIDFKSIASMLSLYREVLLGAYIMHLNRYDDLESLFVEIT